jgi:hypothetical protein
MHPLVTYRGSSLCTRPNTLSGGWARGGGAGGFRGGSGISGSIGGAVSARLGGEQMIRLSMIKELHL